MPQAWSTTLTPQANGRGKGEHGLGPGLVIGNMGVGEAPAGPAGQVVVLGHLGRGGNQGGKLGRADGQGPGAHVHGRGGGAVHHRGSGDSPAGPGSFRPESRRFAWPPARPGVTGPDEPAMARAAMMHGWPHLASSIKEEAISSENCRGERELIREMVTGRFFTADSPPIKMAVISMPSLAPLSGHRAAHESLVAQKHVGQHHVQIGPWPAARRRAPPS